MNNRAQRVSQLMYQRPAGPPQRAQRPQPGAPAPAPAGAAGRPARPGVAKQGGAAPRPPGSPLPMPQMPPQPQTGPLPPGAMVQGQVPPAWFGGM